MENQVAATGEKDRKEGIELSLDALLQMAMQICGASEAHFYWIKDNKLFYARECRAPDNQGKSGCKWKPDTPPFKPEDMGVVGIAASSGEAVRVDDIRLHPHLQVVNGCTAPSYMSEMAIPFPLKENSLASGLLQLVQKKRSAFTREHETSLKRLCEQASVGITLAQHQTKLKALRRIDEAILAGNKPSENSYETMFSCIVQASVDIVGAKTGQLYEYDQQRDRIRSLFPKRKKAWAINSIAEGACIRDRKCLNFNPALSGKGKPSIEPPKDAHSVLAMPIAHEDIGVIGLLRLESPIPEKFTKHDENELADLCRQAAIPIQYIMRTKREKEDREKLQQCRRDIQRVGGLKVFEAALNAALAMTKTRHGQILMAEGDDRHKLCVKASTASDIGNTFGFERCASGRLFAPEAPDFLIIHDTDKDPSFVQQLGLRTKSALMVPFYFMKKRQGVINLEHTAADYFTDWHVELVQEIAEMMDLTLVSYYSFRDVAHHFKGPATNICVNANTINQHRNDSKILEKACNLIRKNVSQIKNTVDDILPSVSLPDAVDPVAVLEETLEARCTPRGVAYSIQGEESVLPVYFDRKRLSRVFGHLVDNAIRAMEKSPDKKITTTFAYDEKNRKLHFHIKDSGMGIPEEYAEKIFQLNSSLNKDSSGLGLFSVSEALSEMGGTIALMPREEGKGAHFMIQFQPAFGLMLLRRTTYLPQEGQRAPRKIAAIGNPEKLVDVILKTWDKPRGEIVTHSCSQSPESIRELPDVEMVIFDPHGLENNTARAYFKALQTQYPAPSGSAATPEDCFLRRAMPTQPTRPEVLDSLYRELNTERQESSP